MVQAPNILVVEDGPSTRESCRDILVRAGYAAMSSTGARALRDVDRADYRVILFDLDAVGRDGLALLDAILERHPGMAVIGIQTDQTLEDVKAAFRGGASDLLARPLDPASVGAAVAQALERRSWQVRRDEAGGLAGGEAPCWLEYEGGGRLTVGVERGVLEALVAPIYVELPLEEQRIPRGGTLLRILTRDGAIHDVASPVAGVVLRVNESLLQDADAIRHGGWAVRISLERQTPGLSSGA